MFKKFVENYFKEIFLPADPLFKIIYKYFTSLCQKLYDKVHAKQ